MNRERKNRYEKVVLYFFVFLLLGTITSIQFRSVTLMIHKDKSLHYQYDELVTQLNLEQEETYRLKSIIERNMESKDQLIKESLRTKEGAKQMEEEWRQAMNIAGLYDMEGPGIEIIMQDALEKTDNPKFSIIHDSDVLKVINELNAAGAKAISINGERYVSTSEIICTGPTVRVNKNRYTVPFEIKAVGNPEHMDNELENSFIVNDLRAFNIRVDIKKYDQIKISKFSGQQMN